MKQLLTDVKTMTLIAGSAAVSLGATALLLRGEPSNQQAECFVDPPAAVSGISISPDGAVAVVIPGGDGESLTLCASVEDHGRKRRKRRRHPHADHERERIQVRVARDRAVERAIDVEALGEREIEDAIERALESVDEREIEAAIERALESLDEDEIAARVEAQLRQLERRLERVGNGGN